MNTHSFSPRFGDFVKVRHLADSNQLSAFTTVRGRIIRWRGTGTIEAMKLSKVVRSFYFWMALIVAVAAWIRIAGISSEQFWLDEVFTISLSSGSLEEVVVANARDTHPPLYYLGVAAARRVFGDSEVVIRGYSTAMSLFGIIMLMMLGRDVGGPKVAAMAGFLAALNPLDLYYAQEGRMYSQAAFLVAASSWFLWRWLSFKSEHKKLIPRWIVWAILFFGVAVLLCFTHLLGTLVLLAQGIFAVAYLLWERRFQQASLLAAIGFICVSCVVAWGFYVIDVRGMFFSGAILGWIPRTTLGGGFRFLVDQFFLAFCGRMPGMLRLWVSVFAWAMVAFVFGQALFQSVKSVFAKIRYGLPVSQISFVRQFLMWMTVAPVVFALLASRLFNPVYFAPRFSLLVLSPFLILAAVECHLLKPKAFRVVTFGALLTLMGVGSWWQTVSITKSGMAAFAEFWHEAGPPEVAVFVPEHNRVMAAYYTGQEIPRVDSTTIERRIREADSTVFWVCSQTGRSSATRGTDELADWVIGLGPHRQLGLFDRIEITEVAVPEIAKVYFPFPDNNQINFGDVEAEKYLWSGWHPGTKKHRWSQGERAVMVFSLDSPGRFSRITLEMFCFDRQEITVVLNEVTVESSVCEQRDPHLREILIPKDVFENENTLTFHLPDAVAPSQFSDSRDSRVLALGVRWIRIDEDSW